MKLPGWFRPFEPGIRGTECNVCRIGAQDLPRNWVGTFHLEIPGEYEMSRSASERSRPLVSRPMFLRQIARRF